MNYEEVLIQAELFRNRASTDSIGKSILDKITDYCAWPVEDQVKVNPVPLVLCQTEAEYANFALLHSERLIGRPLHFTSAESLTYNYDLYRHYFVQEVQKPCLLNELEQAYAINYSWVNNIPFYALPMVIGEAGYLNYQRQELARMN